MTHYPVEINKHARIVTFDYDLSDEGRAFFMKAAEEGSASDGKKDAFALIENPEKVREMLQDPETQLHLNEVTWLARVELVSGAYVEMFPKWKSCVAFGIHPEHDTSRDLPIWAGNVDIACHLSYGVVEGGRMVYTGPHLTFNDLMKDGEKPDDWISEERGFDYRRLKRRDFIGKPWAWIATREFADKVIALKKVAEAHDCWGFKGTKESTKIFWEDHDGEYCPYHKDYHDDI